MPKPASNNTAPKAELLNNDAFGGELVTVATGFPPYWEPEEGKTVDLIPQMVDNSDPSFIRFVCQNIGGDLECHTGPKDDDGNAETIVVRNGELFTVGWYATLPLEYALSAQVPVRVQVLGLDKKAGKNPDGTPKKLWHFKYQTSPKGAEMVNREKARVMAFGPRNPKTNPTYLLAFTPDGMRLSAPPAGAALGAHSPDAEG